MDLHRRVRASGLSYFVIEPPFSCFDWVESSLEPTEAVRRCFSLARSLGTKTFIAEDIPAVGLIQDENEELVRLAPDYTMRGLKRISFWTTHVPNAAALSSVDSTALCGYAIMKHDRVPSRKRDGWHVFEAVFKKYPHEHNCVPSEKIHNICVNGKALTIRGVLYAQQNSINKVCAHVALRTLLSRRLPAGDVSYSELNKLAAKATLGKYDPSQGLCAPQIRAILNHYDVPFRDIDYAEEEKRDPNIRQTHPFQKYLYAGIESGCGALLGFRMTGPSASDAKHIVPFFGHTFNKDTWVPNADVSYFDVGGGVGYIPSECWTSSFLGHDDNFGPNLCVPRLYVKPEQAEYVVEILPDKVTYSGLYAEAVSLIFLYSLRSHMEKSRNPWMRRLAEAACPGLRRVVLRAVCIPKETYLRHVCDEKDWERKQESLGITEILKDFLPDMLWVVEVSLPHLFPANEHKLGEILLNPFIAFDSKNPVNYNLFLLARLPSRLFVLKSTSGKTPSFLEVPSACESHRAMLRI